MVFSKGSIALPFLRNLGIKENIFLDKKKKIYWTETPNLPAASWWYVQCRKKLGLGQNISQNFFLVIETLKFELPTHLHRFSSGLAKM